MKCPTTVCVQAKAIPAVASNQLSPNTVSLEDAFVSNFKKNRSPFKRSIISIDIGRSKGYITWRHTHTWLKVNRTFHTGSSTASPTYLRRLGPPLRALRALLPELGRAAWSHRKSQSSSSRWRVAAAAGSLTKALT